MKVKQLIKELLKVDQERLVVMSKDSEGNGYSPLSDISEGAYQADSTWSGEFGLEKLTAEDRKDGFSEEDIIDGVKAICLHPTN
jgi:hypothetical protein